MTSAEPPRTWRQAVGVGLGMFVISRVIVFGALYARSTQRLVDRQTRGQLIADNSWTYIEEALNQWDGKWYRLIAERGYPQFLPTKSITYFDDVARVAFFPVYPMLARWFDNIFPGGVVAALIGVNVVLAMIAVVLVGLLAREVFDVETAERAMVLFALFPASAVLSWTYAEAALIVFAAACLLFLLRHQWWLAGIAAAVATATRPNGVAVIAACVVASAIAIARRRDWMSLVSVVLAPVGVVGFHLFLGWRTGDRRAWFRVQHEAWNEGTSWGATAIRYVWRFSESPLQSAGGATYMHTTVAIGAFALGVFCTWRKRLPWPLVAYVLVVAALMFVPSTVSARPRFVYTAFPLVIAIAAWWPRRSRYAWDALLITSAGLLAAFTMLYASFGAIP